MHSSDCQIQTARRFISARSPSCVASTFHRVLRVHGQVAIGPVIARSFSWPIAGRCSWLSTGDLRRHVRRICLKKTDLDRDGRGLYCPPRPPLVRFVPQSTAGLPSDTQGFGLDKTVGRVVALIEFSTRAARGRVLTARQLR